MNRLIVITGRIGKTSLANELATLFDKREVFKTVSTAMSNIQLRHESNRNKLVIIDECDKRFVNRLVVDHLTNAFNCNIIMVCGEEPYFYEYPTVTVMRTHFAGNKYENQIEILK